MTRTINVTVTAASSSFTVTNTNDSGAGSLRWAIEQAGLNANATVNFGRRTDRADHYAGFRPDLMGFRCHEFHYPRQRLRKLYPHGVDKCRRDPGNHGERRRTRWHLGVGLGDIQRQQYQITNFALISNETHNGFGSVISTVAAIPMSACLTSFVQATPSRRETHRASSRSNANVSPWLVSVDRCVFSSNTMTATMQRQTARAPALYLWMSRTRPPLQTPCSLTIRLCLQQRNGVRLCRLCQHGRCRPVQQYAIQ